MSLKIQVGFGVGRTKSKSIVVDGGRGPLDLIFVIPWILTVKTKVADEWISKDGVLFEVKVNGVVPGEERVFVRPADPNLFQGGDIIFGENVFDEEFASGLTGVFGSGEQAGNTTDIAANYTFRLSGEVVLFVGKNVLHDLVPDRRGAGDAGGNIAHGRVVVVADPSGDQNIRSEADGPVVAHVIGGPGLDANRFPRDNELTIRAKSADASIIVQENVADDIGDLFGKDDLDCLVAGFGRK